MIRSQNGEKNTVLYLLLKAFLQQLVSLIQYEQPDAVSQQNTALYQLLYTP
ncbi:hypothetical protein DPMN_122067 [Dreissena polymorpha]|uniref:Uncharacterized protein n=1 Tax=Dreissena polymorpha TaxID=45954 RepID=A0A9D4GMV3_DREPO|nr:hypothetical protein DPMN_122067 [Dreissena polymorpha]